MIRLISKNISISKPDSNIIERNIKSIGFIIQDSQIHPTHPDQDIGLQGVIKQNNPTLFNIPVFHDKSPVTPLIRNSFRYLNLLKVEETYGSVG